MKGGYWQSTATCKTSHHCLSTKQTAFLFTTTYICITLSPATCGKIYCNPDVFFNQILRWDFENFYSHVLVSISL